MFISALCDYYDVLAKQGKVLPAGYSKVGIHSLIALTEDGKIESIIDCQETITEIVKGKVKEKKISKEVVLPKRTEKPGIDGNIIEHRPLYIFGLNYDAKTATLSAEDKTDKARKSHYQADSAHGGRLPVHVHFVMDEFPNVALPDEFDKLLSTMRSREISVSIIIQNMAQLKALFEKQWESIVGNCDEFLYLGGNEQSTHEYVSKLLGKETIDTNTYGQSHGRNGSYSTNWQITGRELMTPDEVRMLDNDYALLFIRGERPIRDFKYDIHAHPNVALTADGGTAPYIHGKDTMSFAEITLDKSLLKNAEMLNVDTSSYELLSEEELDELYKEESV